MPFRKVLVANRGEIALRIVRALREAGIASVAVYSEADRTAAHVLQADEAYPIGPAPSAESYLCGERIIAVAKKTGAEAVHPGYGFLSENAGFAASCQAAGLVFVGPSPASMRLMGSKTEARKTAARAGVPTVPGTADAISDPEEALRIAGEIGYPVMVKAAAGGGGKGMRRVDSPSELDSALRDAASEAERSFRNAEVYLEKLLIRPRHIEIQILADQHGHTIHLGERECSIQRRHQKIVEECPSPLMTGHPMLRAQMGEAAVRAARAAGYHNAGTIEFLVDKDTNFYFLEMNTRLQVEHPVTELVTGVDLVQWQLRIAAGERLTLQQEDVRWDGHAIECRLYAEDPDNNFFPSPGRIESAVMPEGPGTRVDGSIHNKRVIPLDYDPLLAKITCHAGNRQLAIGRMRRALRETHVGGIKTNLHFFSEILADEEFQDGRLDTGFIEQFFQRRQAAPADSESVHVAALIALHQKGRAAKQPAPDKQRSRWLAEGRAGLMR